MKKYSKTFYLLAISFLILVFFIIPNLKFSVSVKNINPIVQQTVSNNTITTNTAGKIVPSITNDNKKKPLILSEEDKEILATLVKEGLPKDISNVKLTHLSVPIFQQEYTRSCEEASLRMVLAFYGIQTNDMDIVKKVGYDPRPWDIKNNIWDDPNKMFVGYIDDPNKSGYGTFSPAIAGAAKSFGHDAQNYLGVSSQFIAQQIYNGNPVIVWGFFKTPPFIKYSWNTDNGKKVTAYRGEHVRVVTGFYGDISNPVGFLINDPLTGDKDVYWSTDRLMTQMNMYGNLTNQAVVVK